MARFETLLAETRAGIPAAPDFTLLRALRFGAQELCRQSHCWREVLDPIATQVGVGEYDFGAPSGSQVERILWLKFKGVEVRRTMRARELLAMTAGDGAPCVYAISPIAETFYVWPTPRAEDAGNLEVMAVLVPTATATGLPDELINKYRHGIIAIAKAQLMALSPGMPWHNPENAAVQAALGAEWVARAKREQHSGGHVPLRVNARPFA